jgi:hypothetical protein
MMTHEHDNTSRLDIVFLHPLAASILKATNQHNKPPDQYRATYPQSRRKNRHRRCAAANLPSLVLLNGVTVAATLAATLAPTVLAPAFVPGDGEEEGKDDDTGAGRSSIGGKRSLSMSDLRLWATRAKS